MAVLEAETKRWSAMSWERLAAELADDQVYEVEFESRKYQVEVELLENAERYVHVAVSVDEQFAGIDPAVTDSFIRNKESSGSER